MANDVLKQLGIVLLPEPQRITPKEGTFKLGDELVIIVARDADDNDKFAASNLAETISAEKNIKVSVTQDADGRGIHLRRRVGKDLKAEGYCLRVTTKEIIIEGNDAAGLFWGTRTLLQTLGHGATEVPCMEIEDWPDLKYRMIHYDTKHHQGTYEYVQDLLKTLASYKVNIFLWEWEDKLAYERHPEIGAPGAFTKAEMQELTMFAKKYHIQIVPLVQGLGHVSYILKHPQHRHLREIPNSAWEFCPLKEESYELLFDLWDEAMEATPGSEFIHIGSDETYELGLGEECGCKAKAQEIGRDGLMAIFLEKSAAHISTKGRKVLSWAARTRSSFMPPKNMLLMGSGLGGGSEPEQMQLFKNNGYEIMAYAPNPGIEPLFLSYFPWTQYSNWRQDPRRVKKGCFWDTSVTLAKAGQSGLIDGSITTSWDDSGLHMQAWVPRFVCAAEYSWNSRELDVDTWVRRFFSEYFGPEATDMIELFRILGTSANFFYDTFQRKVWHWGDIGKVHVPDFPRQDLEYSEFWCQRYAQMLHLASEEKHNVERALKIIDENLAKDLKNKYDLEIYRTCAELMLHNIELILMLGKLEEAIKAAHLAHYSDRQESLTQLENAQKMIEEHLHDRKRVYENLVAVWERTRLPKGLSTPDKQFVWSPDRARHYANRTPDMRYLIMDEELLGLEKYLDDLKEYIKKYKANIMS